MTNPESKSDLHPEDSPLSLDEIANSLIGQRYRVIKLIDAGGMASVFRAYDERLARDVALKIMHAHLAHNIKIRQRFETEARAAARLLHPGIVQIYDQGIWHGRAYLVMEFVNGSNLRQLLNRYGPLSLGKALVYTKMILTALKVAHNHQIIHRDIKPENVLVCQDGQVKVADFGLAHAVSQATGNNTGTVMGTVAYLAPEIITQEKSDVRSDLYAVGAMLYELLTGFPPHVGKTSIGTAWAHVNQDIPSIKTVVEWIPDSVDALISQLCARNPEQRPTDTDSALELLENIKLTEEELSRIYVKSPLKTGGDQKTVITSFEADRSMQVKNQTRVIPNLALAEATEEDGDSISLNVAAESSEASTNRKNRFVFPPLHQNKIEAAAPKAALVETIAAVIPNDEKNGDPDTQVTSEAIASKKRKRLFLILLAMILLLGAAIALWFTYGPGNWVKIPNLAGKTVLQAENSLKSLHLKPTQKQEFSDTIPTGKIIGTNPKAGRYVYYNTSVELRISRGIKMVKVPDLKNLSLEEAKKILVKADLKVGEIAKDYSDDVTENMVADQSIAADKVVKHGSLVNIVISKGKEPVTLPDFSGKKLTEIKTILESLKLSPDVTETYSDSVAEGQLIKQEPEAGKTVYHGDKIKLTISKGPETVAIPNLVESSTSQAKEKLQSLGLEVIVKANPFLFSPRNKVSTIVPAPGTKVKRGTTVTIYYY